MGDMVLLIGDRWWFSRLVSLMVFCCLYVVFLGWFCGELQNKKTEYF
jgi:hypothetical protein